MAGRASAFWRWAGCQAANSYVKINLSLFELYPREHAPSIPPELILLGNLIYEMSSLDAGDRDSACRS